MKERITMRVSGRVQGVYFRAETRSVASRYGLSGTVRNMPDGSVEIVAEGERDALARLAAWARIGPPAAAVTGHTVQFGKADCGFAGFTIARDGSHG
jgi:acylphosphatase